MKLVTTVVLSSNQRKMMKDFTSLIWMLAIIVICSNCTKKPDSIPSTLFISTQSDIDKYSHLLNDLEVAEFTISFENSDNFDLNILNGLQKLTRGLIVRSQEQLDGLTNLRELQDLVLDFSGDVTINNVEIVNGLLLTNSALRVDAPSLKRINGRYVLSDTVEVLGDFSNVEYINEIYMQYDNLETIEDFLV